MLIHCNVYWLNFELIASQRAAYLVWSRSTSIILTCYEKGVRDSLCNITLSFWQILSFLQALLLKYV